MKRVIGTHKETNVVGLLNADGFKESDRRAFDLKCPTNYCGCTFHFRKAHMAGGNTEKIYATFVKNPSSSHEAGCPNDIERIVRENHDYITMMDGKPHVRVNFPLGASTRDLYPQRHMTEEFTARAKSYDHIKPFSSLHDLSSFIEKNFGAMDSDAASEIIVIYQGHSVAWSSLFKGSDQYDKLNARARNYKFDGDRTMTSPAITIVKPVKEASINDKGKRRFECESQRVKIDNRWQYVVPVIVCDGNETTDMIVSALEKKSVLCVTARPFNAGPARMPSHFPQQRVTLLVKQPEQLCEVSGDYWKVMHKKENQLELGLPKPLLQ